MRRVFVLINNSGIGGSERRLGRLFATKVARDPAARLVINAGLWRSLAAGAVVSESTDRVWRLPEPFGWIVDRSGLRDTPWGFWIKKLDYVLFAALVAARFCLGSTRTMHLVLGGVYLAIPLMLLRPSHRFVVSVTHPDLTELVGVPWAVRLYRFALERARVVDCLTDQVRSNLQGRGVTGEKMVVSEGSVVDAARFRPASEKADWIVFAGRLIDEKNPRVFLEAVPIVRKACPDARLFLLGDGPLASELDRMLHRLGLEETVTRGFYPDLAPILAKARVFVSLQRTDNYPSQSLLEAMACGTAVVATDVGLTRTLVDQATGLLVEAEPEPVARAIIELLDDPEQCRRLGEAGRERVRRLHSEQRYLTYMEQLYARAEERRACASAGMA